MTDVRRDNVCAGVDVRWVWELRDCGTAGYTSVTTAVLTRGATWLPVPLRLKGRATATSVWNHSMNSARLSIPSLSWSPRNICSLT